MNSLERPTKTADPKKMGRVTFKNNKPQHVATKTANNFFINTKLKNDNSITIIDSNAPV